MIEIYGHGAFIKLPTPVLRSWYVKLYPVLGSNPGAVNAFTNLGFLIFRTLNSALRLPIYDWIRTEDLWLRSQPTWHECHNRCTVVARKQKRKPKTQIDHFHTFGGTQIIRENLWYIVTVNCHKTFFFTAKNKCFILIRLWSNDERVMSKELAVVMCFDKSRALQIPSIVIPRRVILL